MFGIVIETLANAGNTESAGKACQILNDMFDLNDKGRNELQPDTRCLNACLLALCQTRDKDYASRAVRLLTAMIHKYNNQSLGVLPSLRTFQTVIQANLDQTNMREVCVVLNHLFQLHAAGRADLEPDSQCLDVCLHAMCQTGDSVYIHRAVQLLSAVVERYIDQSARRKPSPRAFSVVLDTCLRQGLQQEASSVRALIDSVEPAENSGRGLVL